MNATPVLRSATFTAVAMVAFTTLSGCGLLGTTWDVRMEVTGTGEAKVSHRFAGGRTGELPDAIVRLPWHEAASVGFGFNELRVDDAAPGTKCRILVNGRVMNERTVDRSGHAACDVNLQE